MSAQPSLTARLLRALSGHSFAGLRLSQIARAVEETPPTTLRALQRLASDGLVEVIDPEATTPSWRLGRLLQQIAHAHLADLAREEQRLAEYRHNTTRTPT